MQIVFNHLLLILNNNCKLMHLHQQIRIYVDIVQYPTLKPFQEEVQLPVIIGLKTSLWSNIYVHVHNR